MDNEYQLVRTIRFKNKNTAGILGRLTTAIGKTGTSIGSISTVHIGNRYVIRDIDVFVSGKDHLARVLNEVSKIPETKVMEIRDAVLEIHKNGIIKMVNTLPVNSMEDVRKIYWPGVSEVCRLIADNDSWKDIYTIIPYSVAMITNGSAVLEFGNIGPAAAMPAIEGKAALLQKLAGISGIPLLLNTGDPDAMAETIEQVAGTFGGIHLTGISSPQCFDLIGKLHSRLHIPVMHDDQEGNATVALAALINACKHAGKVLEEAAIGVIGLGTTGTAIAKLIYEYTGQPVMGFTLSKVSSARHMHNGGTLASMETIMRTADIVIATTSRGGIIRPDLVKKGQIIIALSQPEPEIDPDAAVKAGASIAINSRAINNTLSFPGIWRGTLDTKSPKINFEMYKAAALAIAGAATEEEILPITLDSSVHLAVTHAVAEAAVKSGLAARKPDGDYFENRDIKKPPWM
jgi:malate dehydrogenase (oxaloacetate-decarboxylating)